MAHVKLSPEPRVLGTFRTRNPPRTESRRRCMAGRRRGDLFVNGGWIFKSGVSIPMTLVGLSPEPKVLGTWRTRHPLRKEQPRRYMYFHSRTNFQEEPRGPHPGREGLTHPIHNLLCSAPEIGQQPERRVGLQIKLANPRLPRSKQSRADNIHAMPASGGDYRGRPPPRAALLVRWPEARRARDATKPAPQVPKYTAFGSFQVQWEPRRQSAKCAPGATGSHPPRAVYTQYHMPPDDVHRRSTTDRRDRM
jgi:hypothetical protein